MTDTVNEMMTQADIDDLLRALSASGDTLMDEGSASPFTCPMCGHAKVLHIERGAKLHVHENGTVKTLRLHGGVAVCCGCLHRWQVQGVIIRHRVILDR